LKEVCFECDVSLEMLMPTKENPGRRFGCPKCGDVYVDADVFCDEELELN